MIRIASEAEALAIMNSKGVHDRLGVKAEGFKPGLHLYLINERMLVLVREEGQGTISFHPCQSRENWKHIHGDLDDFKAHMRELGYSRMITNIADRFRLTKNLAAKHNGVPIDYINGEVIYQWVL